ncbi:MAG: chemotaxis protein CheW [Planctomycetes bacterium]|nr:chemotaxis protein CheW [Planctomycetota bacterium]
MSDMDDVVNEFLVESYENLDRLDTDLVSLEENPTERAKLASIFRTIHTIKGTCGFLGYGKLEKVAHVGENLLSKLRDGELVLDADITSGLLAMVDAVRKMLGSIEQTRAEGSEEYAELIELLTKLATGTNERLEKPGAASKTPAAATDPASVDPDPPPLGAVLVESGQVSPSEVEVAHRKQLAGDPLRIGELLVEQGVVTHDTLRDALRKQQEKQQEAHNSSVADTSIRVDVGLLDKLMNLVGELVLARNQIVQYNARQSDNTMSAASQRLNLITTELQESVMKTRMQPIGNVWSKIPRVVRDLAVQCGKEVRIEMEGKETELDKTIIEAIKDPLTHIVRNSVDHGIEPPDVRAAKGKPREGMLLLRAYHEGGQVNIEIRDDGGGIDTERVRKKAIEKGLITAEVAQRMSEREAVNIVFLPGFSTAQRVSNVSGRGVGMDVVRTNIEKIGGQVDLVNQPGAGMTIKIKIPLTLAIIPALLVTAREQRFAIPQVSLLELVRLEGEQARKGIEFIHGAPVHRLRGNLLPVLHLTRELGLEQDVWRPIADDESLEIVVLQADGRPFGLVVDSINDTEEIVVKPLGKQLKGLPIYAGATIMGDGRVALILDVLGLAQRASVVSQAADRKRADAKRDEQETDDAASSLLLFQVGRESRMAVELSAVARLEEFESATIERSGGQEVVQYRGSIMPLVRLASYFGREAEPGDSSIVQVVVYTRGERSIGLVVDRILDIVEESLVAERRLSTAGVRSSAVIQGKVTDLLDAHAVIASVDPTFFEELVAA